MNRFRTFSFLLIFVTLLWTLTESIAQSQSAQKADGPIVSVSGGKVQGQLQSSGGAVFKGIPFAAPPVGDFRWREPQPVKQWTGVRPALEYGHACMQVITDWNRAYASTASEDCLYLNVFTAEWPSKSKKPVMVWLYGGGNWGGSAIGNTVNEPPFDGAGLTPHGVILVTINYRTGLFGFMGHPELTAESPHHASGNYGILDQIAALRWVHDNITNFGGDPSRVTVFGQSAGSVDSAFLVASPLAKGLIQRAILESGSTMLGSRLPLPESQIEKQGILLGQVFNAPTLKELRQVPAAEIIARMPDFNKRLSGYAVADVPVAVGTDGYAVPEYAPGVYRSGKELPVQIIVGSNGHEGGYSLFFSVLGNGVIKGTPEQVSDSLTRVIETVYGKYPDLKERALKAYGLSGAEKVAEDPLRGPVQFQAGTDLTMLCTGIETAQWHSATASAYHYEFTRGDATHPPVHTAELKYVFGHLPPWDSSEKGQEFATMMQKYWTNFAKTGDPNGPGLPVWPKYDAKGRQSMEFSNDGPVVKSGIRSEQCGIHMEYENRELDALKAKTGD